LGNTSLYGSWRRMTYITYI